MENEEFRYMIEGFRRPIIQEKDPYFYICGGRYSYEEIEAMNLNELYLRRNGSIPNRLYKYYSNLDSVDEGMIRNFSKEALINGTVYLQNVQNFDDNYDCLFSVNYDEFVRVRLSTYASLFEIEKCDIGNVSDLMYKIADYLYSHVMLGNSIDEIINGINIKTNSEKVKLQHEVFLRKVFASIIDNREYVDCWRIALTSAIDYEYKNVINYADNFRIACFSESPYLVDMWSRQYADNHHGFCVEYQLPDKYDVNDQRILNLFPVIYSDNRNNLLDACVNELENEVTMQFIGDIYKYGLLAKSKTMWMQQREWRLISAGNILTSDDYICDFFPITKVFLGQKMDVSERRAIIEICEKNGIPYVGVKPMTFDYEMTECPGNCKECVSKKDNC